MEKLVLVLSLLLSGINDLSVPKDRVLTIVVSLVFFTLGLSFLFRVLSEDQQDENNLSDENKQKPH